MEVQPVHKKMLWLYQRLEEMFLSFWSGILSSEKHQRQPAGLQFCLRRSSMELNISKQLFAFTITCKTCCVFVVYVLLKAHSVRSPD